MGYGNPPWEFKGQALYQLSLVKVEEARKYVPPELPLVNFFGYTLGGFYLARYTDSPVGAFEELVALAGLVWDFPTSCAWAARVYVNNKEARDHGISSVGLPSRLAGFKTHRLPDLPPKAAPRAAFPAAAAAAEKRRQQESNSQQQKKKNGGKNSWWDVADPLQCTEVSLSTVETPTFSMELTNLEPKCPKKRHLGSPICEIEMPHVPSTFAPRIQMFLPSFSGATPEYPGLLKYSLRLMTNVRFLKPVALKLPTVRPEEDHGSSEILDFVLGGRPLLCMGFENMEMEVQPPAPYVPEPKKQQQQHKIALKWPWQKNSQKPELGSAPA